MARRQFLAGGSIRADIRPDGVRREDRNAAVSPQDLTAVAQT